MKFRNLKLQYYIIKEMIAIGISGFVRQSLTSVMVVILNHNLAFYGGDIAIAAFGVINRLLMVIFMPILGTVQGMQPIVGFNYGAGDYKRVKDTVMLSIKVTTGISVFGFFCHALVCKTIVFGVLGRPTINRSGTFALRIIVLAFPFVGYQVVGSAFYQSIGKARPSLILSMAHQLIFLIPLVIILSVFFGLTGIWTAFPLADLMAFCLTYHLLSKELRSLNV